MNAQPETRISLSDLQSRVEGPVYVRGDDGLAAETLGFNSHTIHDPDVVVGAGNETDVQEAVRYAVANSLPVFAQATGHGAYRAVTHGLPVLTHRMNGVSIDPDTRIATIGAGSSWAPVVAAAAEYGLAPITGSSPHVGAVGFTLGGGLGPLSRTYGFAVDWARSFRVVTGSGELVTANAVENPDLFWALKGGKGGLGVVTEMQTELVPLKSVYGGGLFFDTENIEAAYRAWVDWAPTAPESVTTSVALVRFPELDIVPPPLRGKFLLHLRFAYVGAASASDTERAAEGERLLAPLRAAAPVYLEMIGELPAAAVGTIHSDPDQPMPVWDRGVLLNEIDQDYVTALLKEVGPGHDVPFIIIETRHLGGAIHRQPELGDCAGGRPAKFSLYMVGAPAPELFERVLPGISDSLIDAVQRWVCSETNVNLAGDIITPEHFASAWPAASFQRLAGVRKRYDPEGVFAYGPAAR